MKQFAMNRRDWLQGCAALLVLAALTPLRALAALWNKPAFEANNVDEALRDLGVTVAAQSKQIVLTAPDMAENGAIVQIEVESLIPGTEAIAILAEKNPTPLLANYLFGEGALPYVITRIKMAETAEVTAIVKAGGKYYSASKKVDVAAGSCS
jgi:sulfur-oxidizing protein SoxY